MPPAMGQPGEAGVQPAEGATIELSLARSAELLTTLIRHFTSAGAMLGIGRDGGAVFAALGKPLPGEIRVRLMALGETPLPSLPSMADGCEPPPAAPDRLVDAVVFDDDVIHLPHDQRQALVERMLAALRPGGRILVLLSEPAMVRSTGDLPHDSDPALDPAAFFGHPELRPLHWAGRNLGRHYGFEFVFEKPWPAWMEGLPPALLQPARRLVRWRLWFGRWRRSLRQLLGLCSHEDMAVD
ncbi:MAG: hypothetical protein AB7F74_21390 [Parvibaculaceae bacterium]